MARKIGLKLALLPDQLFSNTGPQILKQHIGRISDYIEYVGFSKLVLVPVSVEAHDTMLKLVLV